MIVWNAHSIVVASLDVPTIKGPLSSRIEVDKSEGLVGASLMDKGQLRTFVGRGDRD